MKHFDDIIRGKLGGLPPEHAPNWDALNNQLDGEGFDALLRDGLAPRAGGLERAAATAPFGWEALNDKLTHAAELEGELFDRILAQRLADAQPAVADRGWQQLSRRMDTLWPLRRRLARYRVLEIAAAIALLLTFAPLLRDNPISTFTGVESTPSQSQSLSALAILPPPTLEIDLSVYEAELGLRGQASAAATLSSDSRNAQSVWTARDDWSKQLGVSSEPWAWFNAQLDQHVLAAATAASQALAANGSPVTPGDDLPEGPLDTTPLPDAGLAFLPLSGPTQPVPTVTAVNPSKWRLGLSTGALLWNIRTPIDRDLRLSAASRQRVGLGVSVDAIRTLKPSWELGLGVQVASVSYDPDLPLIVIENAVRNLDRIERFEGINSQLATVPVTVRKQLTAPSRRTQVFAKAGVAANVVLNTQYNFESSVGEVPEVSLVGSPSLGSRREVQEADASLTESRAFTPGLLSDGRLSRNAFVSAVAGIDVEHRLSSRVSLRGGIDYNHFLGPPAGVGPNRDRLSNLGLTFGARLSL